MTVKKLPSGKWLCQMFPDGREGRRIRKAFSTKSEAIAYQDYILSGKDEKPRTEEPGDQRTLSDLIKRWYSAHGITLSDGEKRLSKLLYISESLEDPLGTEFSASDFTSYREKRLKGEFTRTNRVEGVTPNTVNHELAYLLAVFNELTRLGEWHLANPLKNVRAFRLNESEMSYLTDEQIKELLLQCSHSRSEDLRLIAKICLATGARWAEAEKLTVSHVKNQIVTFTKTKGKKNRSVPISKELYEEIKKGKKSGRLFVGCYSGFRGAIERSGIELPDGQMTHVLRHTFASHFMANGGNILVLQKILGHSDIRLTMRYAHLSPNHLSEAIKYNPLSRLNDKKENN